MPKQPRHKTAYPGVYYIESTGADGKPEKTFYIQYRREGKTYEEKAGRAQRDDMTPARANLLRQRKINGDIPPKSVARKTVIYTLEDAFGVFREGKRSLKRWADYQYNYCKHLRPRLGKVAVDRITRRDIDVLRRALIEEGYAPGSIKKYLDLIPRIVNYCADRNLCKPFPFVIHHARFDDRRTEFLEEDMIARLLKALALENDPQLVALIKLALYTGMRKMEIVKLEWRDVDLDRGFLFLRDPKGVIGAHIPINSFARAVLESLPKTSAYVLPSPKGGVRDRNAFARQLRRVRKTAGIPDSFRPLHGLRHTYASMMASSGEVDMYTLQKLMTHKSPQMTQRYAHLRDETLKKAADVADSLFAPKDNTDK